MANLSPGQARMAKLAYNLGYKERLQLYPLSRNPWHAIPFMSHYWRLGWRHADMESLIKPTVL